MKDVFQEALETAVCLHKQSRFDEAANIYNQILNRKPFEEVVNFLLADLYLRKGFNGLAINLLTNLVRNNPKHSQAWCNLGVGYRKENDYDNAKASWLKAIEISGESVEVCSNLAGLYADRAEPQKAIDWCDKALKLDSNNVEAKWQKALALLTMKRWKEGWSLYENRKDLDNWDSRKSIDAPAWTGEAVEHLYIHGEQGIGDEVMFASMLPYVTNAKRVTIEVNPALAGLIKNTWPEYTVITQESEATEKYDAKVAIGSLNGMFNKFNEGAYLSPDAERVKYYRTELEKLGPGPYVALTWVGGMKATRVEDRSFNLETLRPIMNAYTCVSAQYSHTNPMIDPEREKAGLAKINDLCTGKDIAEQAALFAAVDAVVTVQQTAVHVAGSIGTKTYAMIGSHPHWRYGVEGENLPWYDSVKLYRQADKWSDVVYTVLQKLKTDLGERNA